MTTKHTPATPLPWRVIEERGNRPAIYVNGPLRADRTADLNSRSIAKLYNLTGWQADAAYIAHAANAYPKLVEALLECVDAIEAADQPKSDLPEWQRERVSNALALLRDLGEIEAHR